ncbi:ABC transporter permease [Chitinophaga japonensis]|uniref:FtsX-like permease family protein n=1 Tax=Chitinophaga japonensis TaxID=104662 RepID=A0A562TCB7_CHIJA|nr:ABC transporter permease [Chitinophaga japonensis]TWI90726.1 FtsX-like permease family protein [Chitinophaga japonensis]
MFKNYFNSIYRHLLKNRIASVINIGGLAIGLAVGILIMIWIQYVTGYNQFHKRLPQLHLLMQHTKVGGEIYTHRSMPVPLKSALYKLPEIRRVARATDAGQQLVAAGDNNFYEKGLYADPDLFSMMTFPALDGNPVAVLQDAGSVVITQSTARKLFGNENAVGKIIRHNNLRNLKVGAVIRDVPHNSTLQFDMVLPFLLYEQENKDWIGSWTNYAIKTWIETLPGASLPRLNSKLEKMLSEHSGNDQQLFAYPFARLHLYGTFENGVQDGGLIEVVLVMGITGIMVLLIACINFMNLATARSEKRAREVGVRKVMGASRRLIILQFLAEALSMAFLALILGVLLAWLMIPWLNRLPDLYFKLDLSNWQLWSGLIIMTLLTGLVAGSYPAFFLSSFRPVRVLKGVIFTGRGGGAFRKALVTFQFIVSIFMIIATIVMVRQQYYAQQRPIGYDPEHLLDIPARGDMAKKYEVLRAGLLQIAGVQSVSAGNSNLIRFNSFTDGLQWPGKTADERLSVAIADVQYDWVKTMGLSLAEGRDFSRAYGADSMTCLLNEAAVREMGLQAPVVGTRVGGKTVIGVVNDFVYNGPMTIPRPMVVWLDNGAISHFFVRFRNDHNWRNTLAQVETVFKEIHPGYPFEFRFIKEEYQRSFEGVNAATSLMVWLGGLAILISCLGLFGLSAFVAERRTKEIGVRKVLGAGVAGIWVMLSGDFLKPVLIAFALATPPAIWVMKKLLYSIEYHTELSWWMFVLAGALAVIIALATVSYQGIKAALVNPVRSLRAE